MSEKEDNQRLRFQEKFDDRYAFKWIVDRILGAIIWFISIIVGAVLLGILYGILHLPHG